MIRRRSTRWGVLIVGILVTSTSLRAEEAEPAFGDKTTRQWIETLVNGDLDAKRQAAYALWNLAPNAPGAAVPLARALRTDDEYLRTTSAKALEKLGAALADAVPALGEALADERVDVRRDAVLVLFRANQSGASPARALDPLIDALDDLDIIVRANAAGALRFVGAAGKKAVPALARHLADTDVDVRRWSAVALATLDPAALVAPLLPRLESDDPTARVEAATYLTWAGTDTASRSLPALLPHVADDDPKVRSAVALALGVLAPRESIPRLLELFDDEDTMVRADAARAIGQSGDASVVPALAKLLHDSKSSVRLGALEGLWTLKHPSSVPAVVTATRDEDPSVRNYALTVLGAVGAGDERARECLVTALASGERSASVTACWALGQLGDEVPAAVAPLLAASVRSDEALRIAALRVLAVVAPRDERVVARFAAALSDESADARNAAAAGLQRSGPAGAAAVPSLIETLKSDAPENVLPAVVALARIGPASAPAAPLVEKLMREDDPTEYGSCGPQAAFALVRIGGERAKLGLDYLIHALDVETRAIAAASFLAELGRVAEPAAPRLRELVKTGSTLSPRFAITLVRILGPEEGADAVEWLGGRLAGDDPTARQAAVWALRELGPDAAGSVPALIGALAADDSSLARTAAEALGAIGPAAKPALPALAKLAEHDDRSVRRVAADAAAAIRGP